VDVEYARKDGGKINGEAVPEAARFKEADFVNNQRTGSVTYHFKEGKLMRWESREVGHLR